MGVLENARHEKFAQELSLGTTQRKAYRVAFPSSLKWKDETVDSKASALAKPLVAEGKATVADVKVKNKGTQKSYTILAEPIEVDEVDE